MQTVIFLALASLLIGLSKGGLGGPVPVSLTVPLLSLALPDAKEAVGIVLPLLIFADLFALYIYRGTWNMYYVRLMLPAGIIGVALGTALLTVLNKTDFLHILGVFTLVAVGYKLSNNLIKSLQYYPHAWHGRVAGLASGFGSSLANAGSPPFTAYMLLQPAMTPITFIGTTTLYFAIINALKIPGFLLTVHMDTFRLIAILIVMPIVPVGVWVGRKSLNYVNQRAFEALMLSLLFAVGLFLVFATN